MFRKLKVLCQVLLLQLSSKSQAVSFEQLPFTNQLQTETDLVLHEQVKLFFNKTKVPGLIIGISRAGGASYYAYGFRDIQSKLPFTSKTIFEAGSITKTFTANLLFQLSNTGLIDLEKPITAYFPDTIKNNTSLSLVTLTDLASHKSGLPRIPPGLEKAPGYTLMQPYRNYKRLQLYAYLGNLKKNKPGKYEYSNLGYGLLSTIVENATGKTYENLLSEYIWKPAGMKYSYTKIESTNSDTATGYFYGKLAAYWDFDCLAGCGAIKSNAEDMLKYLDFHMNNTNEITSKTINSLLQPVGYVSPEIQICYGWHTFENLKHRVFWHNGGTYGFSTFAAFEQNTKTSLIIASNASGVNAHLDKLATNLMIWLMGK